eukprot:UN16000
MQKLCLLFLPFMEFTKPRIHFLCFSSILRKKVMCSGRNSKLRATGRDSWRRHLFYAIS